MLTYLIHTLKRNGMESRFQHLNQGINDLARIRLSPERVLQRERKIVLFPLHSLIVWPWCDAPLTLTYSMPSYKPRLYNIYIKVYKSEAGWGLDTLYADPELLYISFIAWRRLSSRGLFLSFFFLSSFIIVFLLRRGNMISDEDVSCRIFVR